MVNKPRHKRMKMKMGVVSQSLKTNPRSKYKLKRMRKKWVAFHRLSVTITCTHLAI